MEIDGKILKKVGIAFFLTAASAVVVACGDESKDKKAADYLPANVEKAITHAVDGSKAANAAPSVGCIGI